MLLEGRQPSMRIKHQSSASPCGSCKLLRRRCSKDCIFAPYFPADDTHEFASVHKVFGASNISRMLQDLPVHQRSDAVCSMVYEAKARVKDPVYGCVGAISSLLQQVRELQLQLAVAKAEIHVYTHHEDTKLARNMDCDSYTVDSPSQIVVHNIGIMELPWITP